MQVQRNFFTSKFSLFCVFASQSCNQCNIVFCKQNIFCKPHRKHELKIYKVDILKTISKESKHTTRVSHLPQRKNVREDERSNNKTKSNLQDGYIKTLPTDKFPKCISPIKIHRVTE
jgi:hypothetical protein